MVVVVSDSVKKKSSSFSLNVKKRKGYNTSVDIIFKAFTASFLVVIVFLFIVFFSTRVLKNGYVLDFMREIEQKRYQNYAISTLISHVGPSYPFDGEKVRIKGTVSLADRQTWNNDCKSFPDTENEYVDAFPSISNISLRQGQDRLGVVLVDQDGLRTSAIPDYFDYLQEVEVNGILRKTTFQDECKISHPTVYLEVRGEGVGLPFNPPDWQVYINEGFGFEIKLPKYFSVEQKTNEIIIDGRSGKCLEGKAKGKFDEVRIVLRAFDGKLSEISKRAYPRLTKYAPDGKYFLNGQEGYFFVETTRPGEWKIKYLISVEENKSLGIEASLISETTPGCKPEDSNTADFADYHRILSTFRFLKEN